VDGKFIRKAQKLLVRQFHTGKNFCLCVVSEVKTTVVGASQSSSRVVGYSTAADFTILKRPSKTFRKPSLLAKAPPLHDDMAQYAKRVPFFTPEHYERPLTHEPFRLDPGEIGKRT
jgi:hypothetical protein